MLCASVVCLRVLCPRGGCDTGPLLCSQDRNNIVWEDDWRRDKKKQEIGELEGQICTMYIYMHNYVLMYVLYKLVSNRLKYYSAYLNPSYVTFDNYVFLFYYHYVGERRFEGQIQSYPIVWNRLKFNRNVSRDFSYYFFVLKTKSVFLFRHWQFLSLVDHKCIKLSVTVFLILANSFRVSSDFPNLLAIMFRRFSKAAGNCNWFF